MVTNAPGKPARYDLSNANQGDLLQQLTNNKANLTGQEQLALKRLLAGTDLTQGDRDTLFRLMGSGRKGLTAAAQKAISRGLIDDRDRKNKQNSGRNSGGTVVIVDNGGSSGGGSGGDSSGGSGGGSGGSGGGSSDNSGGGGTDDGGSSGSEPAVVAVTLTVVNNTDTAATLYWVNPQGELKRYATVEPQQSYDQPTYSTHQWVAVFAGSGEQLTFTAPRSDATWDLR
jgi:hypothetical protein